MPGSRRSWYWPALLDTALLVISFVAAIALRIGWPPPAENLPSFQQVVPLLALSGMAIYFSMGLYSPGRPTGLALFRSITLAQIIFAVTSLGIAFWVRSFALPRSVWAIALFLHYVGAAAWRYAMLLWEQRQNHSRRVAVVADPSEAGPIVRRFLSVPPRYFRLICTAQAQEVLDGGLFGLSNVDVLVIGTSVSRADRENLLRLALRANVVAQIIPGLNDILLVGSEHDQIDDLPVVEVKPLGLSAGAELMKRILDVVISTLMLLVAAPIMLLVWVVIQVDSPGAAIFSQERVGRNGQKFRVHKFRTMVVDAEQKTGPVLATVNDPRITRSGQFLRSTRLDELPQLWNVICGEMSLVGPRPERPFFVDKFSRETPDYVLRHIVRPGLTGLAQVMGNYSTSAEDKLRFDLSYIRHYSLWMDLRVLLLTVRAVVLRDSSRGVDDDEYTDEVAAILERRFSSLRTSRE